MINAGKYNRRVSILARTTTLDPVSGGVASRSWSVAGATWAAVTVLTGLQVERASQLFEGASVQFELRRNPSLPVTPDMGIRYDGVDYEIGAVIPVAAQNEAELRILAKAIDTVTA